MDSAIDSENTIVLVSPDGEIGIFESKEKAEMALEPQDASGIRVFSSDGREMSLTVTPEVHGSRWLMRGFRPAGIRIDSRSGTAPVDFPRSAIWQRLNAIENTTSAEPKTLREAIESLLSLNGYGFC